MKRDTNTHYQWPSGSAVTQVDIRTQKNGQSVAYLYADPATPKDKLLEIRAALRLKGWGTLSDNRNGKFGLRVSGIRREGELVEMLGQAGFTTGSPKVHSDQPEKETPKGFIDNIRTNSLQLSGILYSLGNAIYIASGIHRSKKGEIDVGQIGTGLAFGAGDVLVATIGGKDDARQLTSLLTKLKQHYTNEGIEIPATASIHAETSTKDKKFTSKTYDYLHANVNVIKCLAEVIGGVFYFDAGKKQKNVWKQCTAIIFSLGFGASALIKEKKIDEEKYAHASDLGKLWMRIQANPLSVGGLSGYSNTILTTVGAFAERKNQLTLGEAGNKLYRWDFAAPGVMGVANGLYAASKKTTGGDIKTLDMVGDVYRIASQIINKLPEDQRVHALESTAKFLGERPEVSDTHAQVREKLITQMTIQRKNPWFENITLPARTKAAPTKNREMEAPSPQTHIHDAQLTSHSKGVAAANYEQFLESANGR